MRTIRIGAGLGLLWVWAGDEKGYELRDGDKVVGSLRWERESEASGETADQRWTFKQESFWHRRVTVQVHGSDAEVILFRPSWRGGWTLELEADREFRFVNANLWSTRWAWLDERGQPLVHFESVGGSSRRNGQVVIENRAEASQETPLLVMLGWYHIVQSLSDTRLDG